MKSDVHQVVAQEVIQVSGYTYVRVKERDKEFWIAATRREIQNGETLYYSAAMEMKNFESEELKRKFESIYFVEDFNNLPDSSCIVEFRFLFEQSYSETRRYRGLSVEIFIYPAKNF